MTRKVFFETEIRVNTHTQREKQQQQNYGKKIKKDKTQ